MRSVVNFGYLIFLSVVAAMGGFLFGYDTAVISGTIAQVSQLFERPLKKKLELKDRENRVFEHDSTFFTFRLNNRFSESYFYR